MQHLRLTRIWIASLLIIVLLVGCSINSTEVPPLSVQNPAMYTGAQNVHETDETYLRIIDFVTSDSAGKILAYYKNALVLEGWTFYSDLSDDTREAFGWSHGARSTAYEFTVTVKPEESGEQNTVELKIVTEVPK